MIWRFLYPKPYTLNPKKGFTLIETLVVVGVMALLSAILVVYSRSGENQIVLFKDQAKIIGILLRAKNLTLQSYIPGENIIVCGYGVHFDSVKKEFILFRDAAEPCSSSDNRYSGPDEDFEKYALDQNLKFSGLGLADMLFIPPEPSVIIDGDINKKGTFNVSIESIDGGNQRKIEVNDYGQVTAK